MSILLPRFTSLTWVECPWWPPSWPDVREVIAEGGGLLRLKLKVTEPAPKLASNSVERFTCGGFPVAFCTTKNSLVTISMTWPVWRTKSPFLLIPSDERHPGTTFGWLRSSLVGLDWKEEKMMMMVLVWRRMIFVHLLLERERLLCRRDTDSKTTWRFLRLGCDILFALFFGPW